MNYFSDLYASPKKEIVNAEVKQQELYSVSFKQEPSHTYVRKYTHVYKILKIYLKFK